MKDQNAKVGERVLDVQVSQEVRYPLLARTRKRPSSGEEAAVGVRRGIGGLLAAETQGSAEGGAVCEGDAAAAAAGSPGPSSGREAGWALRAARQLPHRVTTWLFADGCTIGGFRETKLPHCACCVLQNAHTLVPATTRLPKKKQSYCSQSPKKKSLLFLESCFCACAE